MKSIKLLFAALLLLSSFIYSQSRVYVVEVTGTIDLGLAPYVSRVIEDAETNLADAVIFRINTFGGRVDAATQIKDAILDSKVKTIAFVDKRAISAGSLIALSCEKVYMVTGASMGATTVVDAQGKKQAEKSQSYMRGEMRATAEKNGRRPDVAEGMVDETVVIKGLVDSTKLVTLTAEEAVKYTMADSVVTSIEEVLKIAGLEDAEVIYTEANSGEDFIRFLNHPLITSILLMVGTIGLFFEIKTPGWGVPGTAAVIALALFFGTGYILELVSAIEIVLFILGAVLLIVEIFVTPGFGFFGVGGILMVFTSLFLGLLSDFRFVSWNIIELAILQLAGAMLGSLLIAYLLSKVLPKSKAFNRLVLEGGLEGSGGYSTSHEEFTGLVGKKGTALTDLRPSGIALIGNDRVDVTTYGNYIEKDCPVVVKEMNGSSIIVQELKEN